MKRLALLITLFAAFAMSGCEDEYRTYMPDSHWILHADGMVEGHRLALTFDGDVVSVADGSYRTPPFTGSRKWDYYLVDDVEMRIYYTETDSDGGTSTTSYTLGYSMAPDGLTLTLTYDPTFGARRTYTFDRR